MAAGDDEPEERELGGGSARNAATRCPSRWFTPHERLPPASASAFADLHADEERADEPRARSSPRPRRAPAGAIPARASASSTTGITWTTWLRLASSGTTPPQRRWMSICVETTSDERAAAVLDDGGRGLVARGLDAEDSHERAESD